MTENRIQDLLEANNRYLERARSAEAELAAHKDYCLQAGDSIKWLLKRVRELQDEVHAGDNTIVLTAEETADYERTGKLRGTTARWNAADTIVDANGKILKSKLTISDKLFDAVYPHIGSTVVARLAADDAFKAIRSVWLAECAAEHEASKAAGQIIGEIEARFPNWRSYRDLIDCIDCTLYDLRSSSGRVNTPVTGEAVTVEQDAIAQEARRYASFYPQASDGRNTFIIFAEWVEARRSAPAFRPLAVAEGDAHG